MSTQPHPTRTYARTLTLGKTFTPWRPADSIRIERIPGRRSRVKVVLSEKPAAEARHE